MTDGQFIRFVAGSDSQHHHELTGIITEARYLRDDAELTSEEAARLEELYKWVEDHLPVPPFSTSRWPSDVVAWFKDDAREPVRRMWDIVALLEGHGVHVRLLKSRNPGRVVYEDDFQIVVSEWNRL
jgi:hypothetical protein